MTRWQRARETWFTLLPLALLVAIAGTTYWRSEIAMQEVQERYEVRAPSGPDYRLSGFESHDYDAQGRLRRIVHGVSAVHDPTDDSYHMTQAALAFQRGSADASAEPVVATRQMPNEGATASAPPTEQSKTLRWNLVFARTGIARADESVELEGRVMLRTWAGVLPADWSQSLAPDAKGSTPTGDWVEAEHLHWRDPVAQFEGGVRAKFAPRDAGKGASQ